MIANPNIARRIEVIRDHRASISVRARREVRVLERHGVGERESELEPDFKVLLDNCQAMTLSDAFQDSLDFLNNRMNTSHNSYTSILCQCIKYQFYISFEPASYIPFHLQTSANMPGAAFEAAVKQSRELKEKPTDDELLKVSWKHPIYVKILGGWSKKGLPTSIQLL
jgi:hypothetical protein